MVWAEDWSAEGLNLVTGLPACKVLDRSKKKKAYKLKKKLEKKNKYYGKKEKDYPRAN